MNIQNARTHLQNFDFRRLFIEELGWSGEHAARQSAALPSCAKVAHLSGVTVLEHNADAIPDAETRARIHKTISEYHYENILIFTDTTRSQSLWYWVKRQDKKSFPRSHTYFRGQSGDLLLGKLATLAVDFDELDEDGRIALAEVTTRIKNALDIEPVIKKFYGEFQGQHLAFLEHIHGIDDERDRRWYASVLLNRLMFIWFLQKKAFLGNGDTDYLRAKLTSVPNAAPPIQGMPSSVPPVRGQYYSTFLKPLFFEGFAKPASQRAPATATLLGAIPYLNGGLFIQHPVEQRWPNINIPDAAFENLYKLFDSYSWHLDDTPGGNDSEINPDVLGYIFEKYINQKAFGAYYTRPDITDHLCEQTIHRLILDRVGKPFDTLGDLLLALDAPLCKKLLGVATKDNGILPSLRLLDPACGSAAFLVSAMKTLVNIYDAIIGKIESLKDNDLSAHLKKIKKEHHSISYFIKRSIITSNLYGVDIMEEAVEVAKLRLFLALVSSARTAADLEPLPNIEFNIMPGNSLVGLLSIDAQKYDAQTRQKNTNFDLTVATEMGFTIPFDTKTKKEREREKHAAWHNQRFDELLKIKNELIARYRDAAGQGAEDIQALRDGIEERKKTATPKLTNLLLEQFQTLGIRYEQATWDDRKNTEGKPEKRPLTPADIAALKPFHWGYEFDQILASGGFDAIITNPPWEIFKPNGKEFFEDYSKLVSKKKMNIKDFEKEQAKLLRDPDIRTAYLAYLSNYPHVSAFFRSTPQYKNQISIVNGKKAGSDTNLYKLFTEQCYNLMRPGGRCGIVIPSGIYTDLGTKQLRELLFDKTRLTGLFCIENRDEVFEGVHRSFKFVVLAFEKGGATEDFPAAFMRHDVTELARFPREGAIKISVPFVRRLAPDSLSVMEFKSPLDVKIAEKMAKFPMLGEKIKDTWNISLTTEFHMTNDSRLFKTSPAPGRLPLFTGRMFWQFALTSERSGYWIAETEGRTFLLGKNCDTEIRLDYEKYRWVHRRIASNTNERTFVATIAPPKIFTEVNSTTLKITESGISNAEQLFLCAITNSFALDWLLRQKVTTTLNMFYIYQLPVPRLTQKDPAFRPIVERAARLICTTPEFDALAREIFGKRATAHSVGVTAPAGRQTLRAELDAQVAHLYGLTESEFRHILDTFPLVDDGVKQETLAALHSPAPWHAA